MSISSINRVKTIASKLNTNSSAITTIYANTELTIGNEIIANHKIISFNCFIKNLKAFVNIQSLPEISLPQFQLEDTDTDKLMKTLNIEWTSARKQLTLYIANSETWLKVGSLSLLNPSGYPYRVHNLMDLFTDNLAIELGDSGKVGIKVEDVGYGLLDYSDEVTIHGSYVEEIFVSSPDLVYAPGTVTPPITNNTTEDNEMANWIVTASDYTAKVGEKVLGMAEANNVTITLPSTTTAGVAVKVGKYADKSSEARNEVIVNLNGALLDGFLPTKVVTIVIGEIYEFIYINSTIGWSCFRSSDAIGVVV
jgi:hypothetical protein